MRVPKQQIDLRLLLKRMREFFITLALEKKIELKFHPLPPFPPLLGYEGWMERALENLLGNALKYTQEGGVVEVGGAIAPEEGKMEIWVQDNGRGILPEDIQQIFHPFQRGGNALNEPGAGLGLSLVKEVVDLHGGEVQVRSEPGKGSVFSLFFPLKTDHLPEKAGKMAC